MTIIETKGDLFTSKYPKVHCISSDYKMGKGIAKGFKDRGVADYLSNYYGNKWDEKGYCLYSEDKNDEIVYNLVTKRFYWNKPTYQSLEESLTDLKAHLLLSSTGDMSIISMPKIGCGLDKLKWSKVKVIIEKVFQDTDIIIWVFTL